MIIPPCQKTNYSEKVSERSQDNVQVWRSRKRANKTPLTYRSARSTGSTTPYDMQKEAPTSGYFSGLLWGVSGYFLNYFRRNTEPSGLPARECAYRFVVAIDA